MTSNKKGFTLIELMVVVAIIGILASVAIQMYQNYIARAQISEAITLLGGTKSHISDHLHQINDRPSMIDIGKSAWASNNDPGAKYVASMTIIGPPDNITVIATMRTLGVNNSISNKAIAINTIDGGSVWACGYADVGGADATVNTSVAPIYLPAPCR